MAHPKWSTLLYICKLIQEQPNKLRTIDIRRQLAIRNNYVPTYQLKRMGLKDVTHPKDVPGNMLRGYCSTYFTYYPTGGHRKKRGVYFDMGKDGTWHLLPQGFNLIGKHTP